MYKVPGKNRAIAIGPRMIGPGRPCFLIAEAGVNHNGSLKRALRMVDAAAAAGVDAVKFQTFSAERLASSAARKAAYQKRATGAGGQLEMLRRLELSEADHRALAARCRRRGIIFLSTPFDEEAADLLERLGVPAFKVPSGELTNLPLLAHLARKGKPLIVSTGMAGLAEVRVAMRTIRSAGSPPVALLHCVSRYPAPASDANLRAMATLAGAFGVPAGFSDHTVGIEVSLAAAALGACVIEKHFTLDSALPGPDHAFSLEPEALAALAAGVRAVESALGDGIKRPVAAEAEVARAARKSVVAAREIPAGAELTAAALALRRPGTGLPPSALPRLVGRHARRRIAAGRLIAMDMLA